MPHAFVTGGTGFVGSNLVRALVSQGFEVSVAHRPTSNTQPIEGLARLVVADITDAEAVLRAMPADVDVVFHVAASVSFWKRHNALQTLTNVDGTRHVVRAALAKKAKRFVHTSSFAAWGPAHGDVLHEGSLQKGHLHWVNYYRTKALAEREVDLGIRLGLDAVIVNPGNILGPGDQRNWGRSLLVVSRGQLLAAPPGSCPWCHVSDVVAALIAASQRGRCGERYMLGGCHASYAEYLAEACRLLGRPRLKTVPRWLLNSYAQLSDIRSGLRAPMISPEFAHLLGSDFAMRSSKAADELGYQSRSLAEMVRDTHAWLCDSGLLTRAATPAAVSSAQGTLDDGPSGLTS